MRLNDFENFIDDVILKRGYAYFKNGHVESLECDGDEWEAQVSGSDDYTVTVKMSGTGEIVGANCDCPYEFGEYCKHQAAVFYALREKVKEAGKKPKKNKAEGARKESLDEILQKTEKSELVAFILEHANQSMKFRDEVRLRFSAKADMTGNARKLIKSSIKSVMRQGFVEYGYVDTAVSGAGKVLDMAESCIASGDIINGVKLCVIILEEMLQLLQCCDDSNGSVGEMISSSIGLLTGAAEGLTEDRPEYEKIFDIIFTHAHSRDYDGWSDWRLDILSACVTFCGTPKLRDKLETALSLMKEQNDINEYSSRYLDTGMKRLMLNIITRFDGTESADAFIEQNIQIGDFRKMAIEKALAENRTERVVQLCLEGETVDSSFAGLVNQWKEYRYTAYTMQNNVPAQKELAEEFVLDGSFEFFRLLKSLYNGNEWDAVLQRILKNLENSRHRNGIYIDILAHEDLKEKLLAYCEQNISNVVRLHRYLTPEYLKEVDDIFVRYITREAERASSRSEYKNVCGIIKEYVNVCGKEAAGSIRNGLAAKYHKRPAFIDELGKLKV